MEVIEINSRRGAIHILYAGYRYRLARTNQTSRNWRCTKKGCKGSVRTPLHAYAAVVALGQHSHGPDPGQNEVDSIRSQMATAAEERPELAPRRVVSECIVAASNEAKARLPKRETLNRAIQRKRTREQAFPRNPPNREGWVVPDEFKATMGGDNFLLWDSKQEEDDNDDEEVEEDEESERIIMFGSARCVRFLEMSANWFFDSTFKVAPHLFFQVLVLHALLGWRTVACVFVLMPNKTEQTYMRVFAKLKSLFSSLQPRTAMSDFETAAINAFGRTFPNVEMTGCFFHLSQSVFRQAQALGLAEAYIHNEDVCLYVKSLPALAFCDPQVVPNAFEELRDQAGEQLDELYDYFERVYVGRRLRHGRRAPRYELNF